MAVLPFKTFSTGEILLADDLNSSFSQVFDNGQDLGWPRTKAAAMAGFELTLDADGDTSITADTDDQIDIRVGAADLFKIDSSGIHGVAPKRLKIDGVSVASAMHESLATMVALKTLQARVASLESQDALLVDAMSF
jgi:hypothetical protein